MSSVDLHFIGRNQWNEIRMKTRHLQILWLFILSVSHSCFAQSHDTIPGSVKSPAAQSVGITIYDSDPGHLWNRLHTALRVRTDRTGAPFGEDTLDPLLWMNSRHLLVGESHAKAIGVLDEFIEKHGEKLATDPLRKALLQRDLWAVFDWAAEPSREKNLVSGAEKLLSRLAVALNRLVLTREEIASLPDNYKDATRAYPVIFNPTHPEKPFLPPELFDESGPWVAIGNPWHASAPLHARAFGDRSTFTVLLSLPGGRAATLAWMAQWQKVAAEKGGWEKVIFTGEFPAGARVALVRRAMFISTNGELVASRLVESVQMRVALDAEAPPKGSGRHYAPFKFELRRQDILSGRSGGLHAIHPDERNFPFVQFFSQGMDFFEDARADGLQNPMESCFKCHGGGRDIGGLASYHFGGPARSEPFLPVSLRSVEENQERYKRVERPDWSLLRGLWLGRATPDQTK